MTKRETRLLVLVLLLATVALNAVHHVFFHSLREEFSYFLEALAFLPIEVLVLTLLVDRLLSDRERAGRRHKMNMVVGVFISELGRPLLGLLGNLLAPGQELLSALEITAQNTERELRSIADRACSLPMDITLEPSDMTALQALLDEHEDLTLRLLANPVLLEHEDFTDVLWAVVHLGEELKARPSFDGLPPTDLAHLEGDTQRVYRRLLRQWLQYLAHLKQYYPYLFSFAVRACPLHPGADVRVLE
ncbi:MAG: hypothetical protein WCP21_05665 [Armatimonadota bacterium]